MKIGIPHEVKEGELRVALTPREAAALVADGHAVVVESHAGRAVGHEDEAYRASGAAVVNAAEVWDSELVVKVKEMLPADLAHMRRGATLFGFQQLPNEPERVRELAARGVTAIAFEMLRDLLAPMSEISGDMAAEIAASVLGHAPANALVLGAGNAGMSAARALAQAGAQVTVLTRSRASRDEARNRLGPAVSVGLASPDSIADAAGSADVVVGAVRVPGEPTPKLLPRALVARMKRGALIIDISIDAGGVAETSHATTHAQPTYVEEGVVHYCVPNMPAARPREAAEALSRALLPYVRQLAGKGISRALRESPTLRGAVLIWKGRLTHRGIAEEAGVPYTSLSDMDLQ